MTTSVKSSIQMEWVLLCLTSGAPRTSLIDEPRSRTPGNGLLLFFRVDDFDLALKDTRSRYSAREEPRE
jgi:hypothetical protein